MNGLCQVLLFAADVVRLRDFYRDGLGLTLLDEAPGWIRLDAGGVVLALHGVSFPIDTTTERSDTAIKLGFGVDEAEAEAVMARLVARGARMRSPSRHGATWFCDGVDPEGNVFQLTTRATPGAGHGV